MNKEVKFSCPSNIALIKYWGKKSNGVQLPANPSISWTLNDLRATTKMLVKEKPQEAISKIDFYLAGKSQPSFLPKITSFLERIESIIPWVKDYDFEIHSENNFPHGAGIASSAAGFGALAVCLMKLDGRFNTQEEEFWQTASELARLGSGSACRSLFSEPGLWGEYDGLKQSSDRYAIPYQGEIHSNLMGWKDAVLIVEDGEKTVSSTAGHALLNNHAYASARFQQAKLNLKDLLNAFAKGDTHRFIEIVESEALQLHAMMMSSVPYYLLMKPHTLAVIEKVWEYRKQTDVPVGFTLDAGANVHVLYDGRFDEQIRNFINTELLPYCKNGLYLCSDTGGKPQEITE